LLTGSKEMAMLVGGLLYESCNINSGVQVEDLKAVK
jgi:hypothetical protein